MADYVVPSGFMNAIGKSLDSIEHNLDVVNNNVRVVGNHVDKVDGNVRIIYDEIGELARDFREFVKIQLKANAKQNSQSRLIQIRQEMEKRFGHYDIVRRTTTGILQADDLGIVKKDTISNATEELMLSTPGYWLAPCLVALASWINDRPDIAEKALREGIKRNDEKTSLFWALVCRRADRRSAALKWTQRYLANQDESNLDRKTVIILDAYASGLLGSDTEGLISKQMGEWLERLAGRPGFIDNQTRQWSAAINLKRKIVKDSNYQFLAKYSKTWPRLKDVMEGATLHAELLNYFTDIFDQKVSTDPLKVQLDEILDSLVTEFDEEEAPLKKEEKYNQLVVDFDGDEEAAAQNMAVEQTALDERRDFTQLLTDAAMKPESANAGVSTQKFAIALSKEWISRAYNDIVTANRAKIPPSIEINVDTFNGKTSDGKNEAEIIRAFDSHVDKERSMALSPYVLSEFDKFCLWGGIGILIIGVVIAALGLMNSDDGTVSIFFGIIAVIAGVGMMLSYNSKKNSIADTIITINEQFQKKRRQGEQIIRSVLADVVDFRAEFVRKDGESQKVTDFLEQLSPEQYVRRLADSNRRIDVSKEGGGDNGDKE